MPVDTTQPEFGRDIVVHHFSGRVTNGAYRYFEFPNALNDYYAMVANDSPYNLTFETHAWAGDHYGSGSLYLGSIYTHHTYSPFNQGGLSWYSYDYQGPKPGSMSITVTPSTYYDQAFDIYVLTMGPRGGGAPGEPGEGCPPDPLWPYPDLAATSPAANNGGVISHRRVLGGNRKQDIT